eukprot:gene20675-38136_t
MPPPPEQRRYELTRQQSEDLCDNDTVTGTNHLSVV